MKTEKTNIPKCISFIGFMGSGKSTVGKQLAQKLSFEFVDIDEKLKDQEGKSISEIFQNSGENYFRLIESLYLQNVIEKKHIVISCGGGIVTNKHNCETLKQNTYVIWLRNSVETTIARCLNTDRPLLKVENPLKEAKNLFHHREYFYLSTAHLVIDTDDKSEEEVVEEVYKALN